jgi:hypothetical protein
LALLLSIPAVTANVASFGELFTSPVFGAVRGAEVIEKSGAIA